MQLLHCKLYIRWVILLFSCIFPQTFPCSFNSYEESKDGRITMEEFLNYTRKHGYDTKQSQFVFGTFDSNGAVFFIFINFETCITV